MSKKNDKKKESHWVGRYELHPSEKDDVPRIQDLINDDRSTEENSLFDSYADDIVTTWD